MTQTDTLSAYLSAALNRHATPPPRTSSSPKRKPGKPKGVPNGWTPEAAFAAREAAIKEADAYIHQLQGEGLLDPTDNERVSKARSCLMDALAPGGPQQRKDAARRFTNIVQGPPPRPPHIRKKPLATETWEHGCELVTSHAKNAYGYPIRRIKEAGKWKVGFLHREAFREAHSLAELPPGMDVDHMCGNRACINPNHLRLLPHGTHVKMTCEGTASLTEAQARMVWKWLELSPEDLSKAYNLSAERASEWIERWLAETAIGDLESGSDCLSGFDGPLDLNG